MHEHRHWTLSRYIYKMYPTIEIEWSQQSGQEALDIQGETVFSSDTRGSISVETRDVVTKEFLDIIITAEEPSPARPGTQPSALAFFPRNIEEWRQKRWLFAQLRFERLIWVKKQVWGELMLRRQSSKRFGLIRIWPTEASSLVCFASGPQHI